MKDIYRLRQARMAEAGTVYAMIAARVRWMDRQGIHQWNDTDYLEVYPLEYYQRRLESLYVLAEEGSERILCAAILLEADERWNSPEPAFYIHNLVSCMEPGGMGRVFLRCVEALAAERGKRYLRLDSADDNPALEAYYAGLGFEPVGVCQDGKYHGILRQKSVADTAHMR